MEASAHKRCSPPACLTSYEALLRSLIQTVLRPHRDWNDIGRCQCCLAKVGRGEGRTNPVRAGLHHHSAALGIHARLDGRFHSALEKTFIVYLVAANISRPYARGLWFGAAMDATVVLYTLGYFAACAFTAPSL